MYVRASSVPPGNRAPVSVSVGFVSMIPPSGIAFIAAMSAVAFATVASVTIVWPMSSIVFFSIVVTVAVISGAVSVVARSVVIPVSEVGGGAVIATMMAISEIISRTTNAERKIFGCRRWCDRADADSKQQQK